MGRGRRPSTVKGSPSEDTIALRDLKREEIVTLCETRTEAEASTFGYMLRLATLGAEEQLLSSLSATTPADGTTHQRVAIDWMKVGLQLAKSKAKDAYVDLIERQKARGKKAGKLKALQGGQA